jgi:hypothetical protein
MEKEAVTSSTGQEGNEYVKDGKVICIKCDTPFDGEVCPVCGIPTIRNTTIIYQFPDIMPETRICPECKEPTTELVCPNCGIDLLSPVT